MHGMRDQLSRVHILEVRQMQEWVLAYIEWVRELQWVRVFLQQTTDIHLSVQ